jgi:hypothetical protein
MQPNQLISLFCFYIYFINTCPWQLVNEALCLFSVAVQFMVASYSNKLFKTLLCHSLLLHGVELEVGSEGDTTTDPQVQKPGEGTSCNHGAHFLLAASRSWVTLKFWAVCGLSPLI